MTQNRNKVITAAAAVGGSALSAQLFVLPSRPGRLSQRQVMTATAPAQATAGSSPSYSLLPLAGLAAAGAVLVVKRSSRAKKAHAGFQLRAAAGDAVPAAPVLPQRSRSSARARVARQQGSGVAPMPFAYSPFKIDVSSFKVECVERHVGEAGAPPEVEVVNAGEKDGILAARGSIRVLASAREIFERLCDPQENKKIFSSNTASLNYRTMIEEQKEAGSRLFEVSKTGRWRFLGINFNFESTVYAVEDWPQMEIRFTLKKAGAMRHMSGYWRVVPVNLHESIVLFFNEAIPSVPVPRGFRTFASRIISEMTGSLLEDLRQASFRWQAEAPWSPRPEFAAPQGWSWKPGELAELVRSGDLVPAI